ncbi:MAG: NADP-dependent malic enzyme [Candidatus Odinarchaeota archaeon]|nr:NADP-dependent malic enzyme [Candidatus Odinarchaeota archaeon]
MEIEKKAIELHKRYHGKIEIVPKVSLKSMIDLSYYYTPGVAEVSKLISKDSEKSWDLTNRWNQVAIVSDGTRVLGLGNIGPEAALPVMEGKALLFKIFGGVDAFPICLNTRDVKEIEDVVTYLEPTFGGINLEDIESPKCFQICDDLRDKLSIPIWHDDQHGTALVVLAALINALKVVDKEKDDVKITVFGVGSAGYAIIKFLLKYGFPGENIIACDSKGIVNVERAKERHRWVQEIASLTNPSQKGGSHKEALEGSDVLIAATKPGAWMPKGWISVMAKDAIVFALANPVPEIMPEDAKDAGARIVATGRSDFPNQINNVLGFPAVFRGALSVRAKEINDAMIISAAEALSSTAEEKGLSEDYIIPMATEKEWAPREASYVAEAAMKTGISRIKRSKKEVYEETLSMVSRCQKMMEFILKTFSS